MPLQPYSVALPILPQGEAWPRGPGAAGPGVRSAGPPRAAAARRPAAVRGGGAGGGGRDGAVREARHRAGGGRVAAGGDPGGARPKRCVRASLCVRAGGLTGGRGHVCDSGDAHFQPALLQLDISNGAIVTFLQILKRL